MRRFETFITVLVVTGLIAINLFRNNNPVAWIILAGTGLFFAFLFAYHISFREKPCRKA